jgi:hypothetical protein
MARPLLSARPAVWPRARWPGSTAATPLRGLQRRWMHNRGFLPAAAVDVLSGKAHHDTPPLVTAASH